MSFEKQSGFIGVLAMLLTIGVYGRVADADYVSVLTSMPGLVSYWDLNETTGANAADSVPGDAFDGDNYGVFSGVGYTRGVAGPQSSDGFFGFSSNNKSVLFSDDVNTKLQMVTHNVYAGARNLSLIVWMKYADIPTSADDRRTIGGFQQNTISGRYVFCTALYNPTPAGIQLFVKRSDNSSLVTTRYLADVDQWHMWVITFDDGQTATCYLDGVPMETITFADNLYGLYTPEALMFGNDIDTTANRPWKGELDEIAIFNRALSQAEIQTLWDAAVIANAAITDYGQRVLGARPLLYWAFNETDSNSAAELVSLDSSRQMTAVTPNRVPNDGLGYAISISSLNNKFATGALGMSNISKSFAWEFWFKLPSGVSGGKYFNAMGDTYSIYNFDMPQEMEIYNNATTLRTDNFIVNDTDWHHVVIVDNDTDPAVTADNHIEAYLDGAKVTGFTWENPANNNMTLSLGGQCAFGGNGATSYFAGLVCDELAIYDLSALNTAAEVETVALALASHAVRTGPAQITLDPEGQTVNWFGAFALSVVAQGAADISYQWRKNGVNLSDNGDITGANTSVLTVSNVQREPTGVEAEYTCYVSNSLGNDESAPASITVLCTGYYPGDFTGDCLVNMEDLLQLAQDWLQTRPYTMDFVDMEDLADLAYHWQQAAPEPVNWPVYCPGSYGGHLQGITLDPYQNIYWSFTVALVKTDTQGNILAAKSVPTHHGDLTWHDNKIYVAVNFGEFNLEPPAANSWIYVYSDKDFTLLDTVKMNVPNDFGAGGMGYYQHQFVVVGGLPTGYTQNYIHIYDEDLNYIDTRTLPTGYTRLGIQTACHHQGYWWFGCYDDELIKADESFNVMQMYGLYFSHGIVGVPERDFLKGISYGSNQGRAEPAPIP